MFNERSNNGRKTVLEIHEIAKFIKYFNIFSATALAFFAVFGIIAVVRWKSRLNIFRGRLFLQAFCVAALAAFALEATVFNFPHYLKYFADSELATTEVSGDRLMTSEAGYTAEIVSKGGASGLRFKNIDRRVTSIYVDLDFGGADRSGMSIEWTDEESTRGFEKILYSGLPHENYAVIQPHGKVEELTVMFRSNVNSDAQLNIVQVVLNRQIPFYFSGFRLLAVSLLAFAAIVLFSRKLRAKASYCLFECKFDPASRKQNLVYALSVALLVFFSWTCVYTTRYTKSFQETPWQQQYNKYLVDAIIEGRVWLDAGNPEKLLDAERPYDNKYRVANGYVSGVDWMHDWAWYNGKHYCYFGAVPALLLYVPYKLVTGNYLSNHAGIFLFAAVSIIMLAALWRHCVRRWMPGARFAFFLLSFFALYFASGFYTVLSYPRFYVIVQSAGFMFAVAGILLLLKSTESEKVNRLMLFFACLCLALIVGCRPNMIFVSLLVPVVLWKRRSWKLLLPVLIPYVLVAIPVCMYNYARFDSIFNFGANYNLTGVNVNALNSLNPIGLVIRTFISFISYLIFPLVYSLKFPYVYCVQEHLGESVTLGFLDLAQGCPGMINFPVVFCLFYLFKNMAAKNRPKAFGILCTFLIIAAFIMTSNALMGGFNTRYMLDFATFIIIPSLFCAYFWSVYPKSEPPEKLRLKVIYALLAASVCVGLLLFATGGMNNIKDPTWYRYLEYSLGFIRDS